MWLINTQTFELEDHVPERCPPYAILSHRWEVQEVSFRDMNDLSKARIKKGFNKILETCQQASRHGLQYAWVDTCCINKESSAELSEAINSMFQWYYNAQICFVYLCDVHKCPIADDEFAASEWLRRGWTLQELIAPRHIQFFNSSWELLGTKDDMLDQLSSITGIAYSALRGADLSTFKVVTKMSWAARRTTTRKEDMAYSLLGIFDVNLPLLYGEGAKAFLRLQEEIIRCSDDSTIFAWRNEEPGLTGLLAESPAQFDDIVYVENSSLNSHAPKDIISTNRGLSISVEAVTYGPGLYAAPLGCHDMRTGHSSIHLHLYRPVSNFGRRYKVEHVFRRIHLPDMTTAVASLHQSAWCGPVRIDANTTKIRSTQSVPMEILVPQHKQHGLQKEDLSRDDLAELIRKRIRFAVSKGSFQPLSPRTTQESFGPDEIYTIPPIYTGLMLFHRCGMSPCEQVYVGCNFYGSPFMIAMTRAQKGSAQALRQSSIITTLLTGQADNAFDRSVIHSDVRSIQTSKQAWRTCLSEMSGPWLDRTGKICYGPSEDGLWIFQIDVKRDSRFALGFAQEEPFMVVETYPATKKTGEAIKADLQCWCMTDHNK